MLAWENIRHFATPPLVSPRNDVWETSAENFPYWWRVTIQIWVVLLIGWSKFPMWFGQSEATSSVWNFCAHFSDVISQGNQWWCHKVLAVFSGCSTAMLAILTWELQVIIEGLYAKRSPAKKEMSCRMKPFNWGVGGMIANRAYWQVKLKVIVFFGSKLPDFWLYNCTWNF